MIDTRPFVSLCCPCLSNNRSLLLLLAIGHLLVQEMCVHGQHMCRKPAASFENIPTHFTSNSHVFVVVRSLGRVNDMSINANKESQYLRWICFVGIRIMRRGFLQRGRCRFSRSGWWMTHDDVIIVEIRLEIFNIVQRCRLGVMTQDMHVFDRTTRSLALFGGFRFERNDLIVIIIVVLLLDVIVLINCDSHRRRRQDRFFALLTTFLRRSFYWQSDRWRSTTFCSTYQTRRRQSTC